MIHNELRKMLDVPYAFAMDIKITLKYLRKIKDMFLIYGDGEFILEGYSDDSLQSDVDNAKSQSEFVFRLNGGRGDIRMDHVTWADNTTNTLTKQELENTHAQHVEKMGLRFMGD
ncbi:UNVERIFIED_CONTAM: hypothetical protein Scaly_1508800 [Sesamum calycinum]|uniref:Uncharacterized protein n=1 Tax=Sesamum calycinum TaxID=2727403 RepID=A0AAW2PRJ7_9LAMI